MTKRNQMSPFRTLLLSCFATFAVGAAEFHATIVVKYNISAPAVQMCLMIESSDENLRTYGEPVDVSPADADKITLQYNGDLYKQGHRGTIKVNLMVKPTLASTWTAQGATSSSSTAGYEVGGSNEPVNFNGTWQRYSGSFYTNTAANYWYWSGGATGEDYTPYFKVLTGSLRILMVTGIMGLGAFFFKIMFQ